MPSTPIPGLTTNPEINSLGKESKAQQTLDKDGFLRLFVAQLQNQDPTAPMDAAESTQQMTSFAMVEQLTNMAQTMTTTSTVGLIGRTVTYTDADKQSQTGIVERVTTVGGKSTLTVAGKPGVDPTSITQVA